VQQIKELSSAAGRCAGRGCALIRELANGQEVVQIEVSIIHLLPSSVVASCHYW